MLSIQEARRKDELSEVDELQIMVKKTLNHVVSANVKMSLVRNVHADHLMVDWSFSRAGFALFVGVLLRDY